MTSREEKALLAAHRAQAIIDRWLEGNLSRKQIAEEFGTSKGTVDQLMVRLRNAGHKIPRKAPGGRGWIDPMPEQPIVIKPGDQWSGILASRKESDASQEE